MIINNNVSLQFANDIISFYFQLFNPKINKYCKLFIMKKLQNFLLLIVLVSLMNCARDNECYNPELIPFQDKENEKWGFFNLAGKVIIEPVFEVQPTYFQEGFALLEKESGYDYVNLNGDTLGFNFQTATLFKEGMALVTKENGARCFINKEFADVFCIDSLKTEILSCGLFSEGYAKFQALNGSWGYLNSSGDIIIDPAFSKALNFKENYAFVELRDKDSNKVDKLFIDVNGDIKINLDKNIEAVRSFSEGLAAVKDTSGWGFIDTDGNIVIEPNPEWETVTNFINGYAAFMEKEEWGAINKRGKRILGSSLEVPPIFFNGLSIVQEDNGVGFINVKGRKKIKPKYMDIAYPFYKGKAIVKDGKYYVIISKNGKLSAKQEFYNVDQSYPYNVLQAIQGYSPSETVINYSYYRKVMVDGKYSVKGLYPLDEKAALETKCYHFVYNDFNELAEIEYLVYGEPGDEDPFFGCSKVSFEYNDSIEKRTFYDEDDLPIMNSDDVYTEKILLDKAKFRIAKLNLNKYGNLTENRYDVAKYLWDIDANGNRIKEKSYDADNELIIINGIYSKKYAWDRKGNLIEMQFLNEKDQLTANDAGIAFQKWKYDKNRNQNEVAYYNIDSQLEENASGIAIFRYTYDKIGRMIQIEFFDDEDKKTEYSGYKVATILREYDDENDEVNDTYLDIEGNETSL